jgi:hypothetical protein
VTTLQVPALEAFLHCLLSWLAPRKPPSMRIGIGIRIGKKGHIDTLGQSVSQSVSLID